MASTVESELKFELTRAELDALKSPDRLGDFMASGAEVERLTTIYFDTVDERLRKAGASLRIRQSAKGSEQTVKVGGEAGATLTSRTEITVPIEGEHPDLSVLPDDDLKAALQSAIDGEAIVSSFTVAVERTSRIVVTGAGDEVELVLDDGEIRTETASEPILEAEFELKSGDVRALFAVAGRVLAGVPVRFSQTVKSERGYALRSGPGKRQRKPAKAEPIRLDEAMTVEAALRAVMRSCVAQVIANVPVVLDSEDPEGPHQLRIGLRRLRSALSVFRKVIEPTVAARLKDEIRWLGQEVGRLRDLDVLAEEIIAPCASHSDVKALVTAVERHRRVVRSEVCALLSGNRAGALLIDLAAFAETRGWLSQTDLDQTVRLAAPVKDFASGVLQRQWNAVVRVGRRADELDEEERHDLRKMFKKLRYTLEFFDGLLGKREIKRIHRDTKRAQEVLGYLNDVRLAHQLEDLVKTAPAGKPRMDVATARAIGFCQGWHEAHANYVWDEARQSVAMEPMSF